MKPEPITRWIEVDRDQFTLTLLARGPDSFTFRPVRRYRIGVGMDGLRTNPGHYLINDKQPRPTWVAPDSEWVAEEIRGKKFGPNDSENPIKARWLGIADAEGIHGVAEDEYDTLGTAASHGCIRMRQPDVIGLFDRVPLYTPIRIF